MSAVAHELLDGAVDACTCGLTWSDCQHRRRLAANRQCSAMTEGSPTGPIEQRRYCAVGIDTRRNGSDEWRCPAHDVRTESTTPTPVPTCSQNVGEAGPWDEECGQEAIGRIVGLGYRCGQHWPKIEDAHGVEMASLAANYRLAKERKDLQQELLGVRNELGSALDLLRQVTDQSSSRDTTVEINEICQWWAEVAAKDVLKFAPKVAEYGAGDLELMGNGLRMLSGSSKWGDSAGLAGDGEGSDAGERSQVGQEMAISFYLMGKIGRALSAYAEGRFPSDDTLEDIRIYAFMLTRVRVAGRL